MVLNAIRRVAGMFVIGRHGGLGVKPLAARGWGPGAKSPAAGGTGVWGRSLQRLKILHFFAEKT